MVNKTFRLCLISVIHILVFTGCSQENFKTCRDVDEYKDIYETMKGGSTISFLSLLNNSRSTGIENGYPVFTPQDLDYLSSLSQVEFENLRNTFIKKLKDTGIEDIDSIQDIFYQKAYDVLGGHEEIEQLISFAQKYMVSPQGWTQIECLMPKNKSPKQDEIYINMATYIDKIGRPIYDVLVSMDDLIPKDDSFRTNDLPRCREYLAQRLAIAGVAVSVEEFIDAMTGGAATPLEAFATGVDLLSIWLEYEVCNQRWH